MAVKALLRGWRPCPLEREDGPLKEAESKDTPARLQKRIRKSPLLFAPNGESSNGSGKKPVRVLQHLEAELEENEAAAFMQSYSKAVHSSPFQRPRLGIPFPLAISKRQGSKGTSGNETISQLFAPAERLLNMQPHQEVSSPVEHAGSAQHLESSVWRNAFQQHRREDRAFGEAVAEEDEDDYLLQQQSFLLAARLTAVYECAVCGDSKSALDFPSTAPTVRCDHAAKICTECLQTWLTTELDTNGPDGIKCPICLESLNYEEMQKGASEATFAAFDRLRLVDALGSTDEFAWCLKPGCGSGQFNENNLNYMHCAACGYQQCLKHKMPWHDRETCSEYDLRVRAQTVDEEKTEAMLDTVSKKCPNPACGWRIQKNAGCEHMTCRKCKYQFCWLCLASHEEIKRVGNTAHKRDCKFHSENLEVAWPFNVH